MSKLNTSQIVEVVQALVGETDATGESERDRQVRQNQKLLSDVVDTLLYILVRSTKYAERHEGSIKVIGNDAIEYLGYLVKEYDLNDYVWIPVSERLPDQNSTTPFETEYSEPVLISVRNEEDGETKVDMGIYVGTGWYSLAATSFIPEGWEVIAWAERPNPYEER